MILETISKLVDLTNMILETFSKFVDLRIMKPRILEKLFETWKR